MKYIILRMVIKWRLFFLAVGSLVLLKQDLETLKAFYNTNLLTSKMADMYKNANTIIQVKNFNYIPKTNSIVLYNANVLTIEKMRKILGIFRESQTPKTTTPSIPEQQKASENNENDANHELISDNDLLSNPFFTTLKPLN